MIVDQCVSDYLVVFQVVDHCIWEFGVWREGSERTFGDFCDFEFEANFLVVRPQVWEDAA